MSIEIPPAPAKPALSVVFKRNAALLFGLLGLMWVISLLGMVPFLGLNAHGIHPRSFAGLWGILFAPFLHASLYHLVANSVPFVILGGIVLLGGRQMFWSVTVFVALAGGLGVWLLAGANTNHIGASGVIFGYLGFLLARGVVERSVVWFLVSLVILVGYGELLWGVLPHFGGGGMRVSWQSHLFGFIAGLLAARLFVGAHKKVVADTPPLTPDAAPPDLG